MAKVVGIDLGTTNSVVAAIEGGQPSIRLTPGCFKMRVVCSQAFEI